MAWTQSKPAGGKPFTGKHMALVIGLFFGTIISVNLVLAWYSSQSWTGLVTDNPYRDSQRFEATTEERLKEVALGWSAALAHEDGQVRISLTDRAGAPLIGAVVTARFGRPAHENDDRSAEFQQIAGGDYTAPVTLESGVWIAEIVVIGPRGESWHKAIRFTVPNR